MMEILQFYVSGFWTWAGITIGLSVVASALMGATGRLTAMMRALR